MIYKLLAHQTQNPKSRLLQFPAPWFRRVVASPFEHPARGWPPHWVPEEPYLKRTMDHYTNPSKTILSTLRSVNRQLFRETRDLIAFKKLGVDITADFEAEGTDGMVDTIAAVLGQEVLRENVVAVALHWRCCKKGWLACRHRTTDRTGSYFDPPFRESICRRTIARLWAPAPISALSFHAAITALEQFPNLKEVHVLFNHGYLAQWFADPVASMGVFEAFLRRGGHVRLVVRFWYSRYWRDGRPCKKLKRVLERGKGRVVLCGTLGGKTDLELRDL